MSYGSTFVQFDPNGKLSSRLSRSHIRRSETERPHKILQYEKQFDVSLSRVNDPASDRSSVRDSMLAYSNKMRSLQDARHSSNSSQNDPLFVRAKHIPKHPVRTPKKRRPMSFDELLGRDRESTRDRGKSKQRPHSDKHKPMKDDGKSENDVRLPMLTERLRNTGPNVQVSLVSASDLYELVDFSLRSKSSRAETIQMMDMEAGSNLTPRRRNQRATSKFVEEVVSTDGYDKYERIADSSKHARNNFEDSNNTLVPSNSYYEKVFSLDNNKTITIPTDSPVKQYTKLPSISSDLFRRRPNRVKRMKLQDSALGDIPEDTIIETGEISKHSQIEIARRVISPPPHRLSPKSNDFINKPHLDARMEQTEKTTTINKPENSPKSDNEQTVNLNARDSQASVYRGVLPLTEDAKITKKMLIRDDGDVRIEVTQCPPKQETNAKLKAQKRFSKKLIYLRDGGR